MSLTPEEKHLKKEDWLKDVNKKGDISPAIQLPQLKVLKLEMGLHGDWDIDDLHGQGHCNHLTM